MAVRAQLTSEDREAGGQRIDSSVIFDSSRNQSLQRTPSTSSVGTKGTFSAWIKPNIPAYSSATNVGCFVAKGGYSHFQFYNHQLYFGDNNYYIMTSEKYRDIEWMHVVGVWDTTIGSDPALRIKVYVNGERITDLDSSLQSYPTENAAFEFLNQADTYYLGKRSNDDMNYNGNMTQVHMVDGQALDPSYFGYTDELTGEWRPKKYTGDWNILHYNTLNATGGNTILNTNTSGSTIESGYRADSSAGTTANQGLVLAWPGNVVNGDVHDHINTGSSAKTVAAESDAVISTSVSNFYGSSGYINKTDDCFRVTDHADLALGSGDYTVEMWHYPTELFNNAIIYDGRHPTSSWPTSGGGFALITNGTGVVSTYTSGAYVCQTAAGAITTDAWYHIAVVRSSGTQKIYINGIEKASASNSTNHTEEKAVLGAGANSGEACAGYFNDWRIYKGTAKYTSEFNPPTTQSGGNSFYLPMDGGDENVGTDKSGNSNNWLGYNFGGTISDFSRATGAVPILNTTNGGAVASGGVRGRVGVAVTVYNSKYYLDGEEQKSVKFVPGQTVTFDTSDTTVATHPFRLSGTSNGSHNDFYGVDFDGTGDYLSIPDNADFNLGSGDFTLECWINPNAAGIHQKLVCSQTTGGANHGPTNLYFTNGVLQFWSSSNNSSPDIAGGVDIGTPPAGEWSHIAVSREGSSIRLFFNGLQSAVVTTTSAVMDATGNYEIGGRNGTDLFNGKISDFRLVKGTAVYTSDFQPPSVPLTNITNTKLLCCNSSTTTGSTVTPDTITANGDPTASSDNPYDTYVYGTVTSISEGTAGAATTITIPSNAPSDLYYYCTNHTGMGGNISIGATDHSIADPGAWKCTLAMPLNDTKKSSNPELMDYSHLVNCTTYITPNLAVHGDTTVSRKRSNPYATSQYFDGNGDFIQWSQGGSASATDPTALTGNFTIECWVYKTAAAHAWDGGLVGRGANGATAGYTMSIRGSSSSPHNDKLALYFNFPAEANVFKSSQTIRQDVWTHVCAVKEGPNDADIKLYVNGQLDVGTVGANALPTLSGSDNYWLGCTSYGNDSNRQYEGYMSDVRIYKDFCKYKKNFIPASSLPMVVADSPSSVAYASEFEEISSGSVQFSGGNDDYLSWASGADVAFGTGDFTVEGWWYYRKAPDQYDYLIDCRNGSQTTGTWSLSHDYAGTSPAGMLQFSTDSTGLMTSSRNPEPYQWSHIAVTRSGSALKMFINGEQTASATDTTNFSTEPTISYIGTRHSTEHSFDGWLSNLRIVKGTAVYTQNFSVPTKPPTSTSDTTLLCCQSTTDENAVVTGGNTGGVNNGTVWSDHITWTNSAGFGTVEADQPHNMFDGDDSTGAQLQSCSDPNTIIFTPPGGISYSSSVKAYIGNATCTVSVNGGSFDSISSGWNTLVSGSGTLTSIRVRRASSSGAAAQGFKIDDVYLLDPMNKHGYVEVSAENPFDANPNHSASGNCSTLNPLVMDHSTSSYYYMGGLKVRGNGPCTLNSSHPMYKGKWYAEFISTAHGSTHMGCGIAKIEVVDGARQPDECQHRGGWGMWHISGDGSYRKIGYGASWGSQSTTWEDWGVAWGTNGDYDVMGLALDMDNRTLTYYKNGKNMGTNENGLTRVLDWGTLIDAANDNGTILPNTSWADGDHGMVFVCGNGQSGATCDFEVNFGQRPFKYAPPPGHQAATLANTAVRPPYTRPDKKYFTPVIWTGTGAAKQIDLGFQPDLVWIKDRTSDNYDMRVFDSIRGMKGETSKALYLDTSDAEATNNSGASNNDGALTANATGFLISTSGDRINKNSNAIVAYGWKAGGNKGTWNLNGKDAGSAANAGLTAGDTSVLTGCSINTKAGFSIVSWTQDSGGSAKNIAHGLSKAPSFVIMKHVNNSSSWFVVHTGIENEGKVLYTDSNSQQDTSSDFGSVWPGATYTSTNTTGVDGRELIMYSWINVAGLQKFGQYEGTGSGAGATMHLGFRPAMLWIKRTDASNNWLLYDNKREIRNPRENVIRTNSYTGEDSSSTIDLDFTDWGFKMYQGAAEANNNGSKYLYMAWAETPTFNLYGAS